MKYSMGQITGYLKVKGVPQQMIQQIRRALAVDAMQEADNLHWDRIYCSIALALRSCYGYGPQRIMKCMQTVNDLMMEVADGKTTWRENMEKLRDETGIVIRTGDDDRLIIEVGQELEGENVEG